MYADATEGTQATDLGDELHYDVAISYRLVPRHYHVHDELAGNSHHGHAELGLVLELNGEWRQWIGGVDDPDSGRSLVAISPGVRVNPARNWSISLSLQIPLIQSTNGKQHRSGSRLIVGLGMGF
ncbi:MAG: hypothetical protein HYX75_18555 [Acidobacteria bacterium]|nr:hypothetical protein [Acidobacteriota bacterium]